MSTTAARILIVEDNEANAELMIYLLNKWGYTCVLATNGKEGLARAGIERPDLIICDLQMPVMNGYDMAAKARQTEDLRDVPLIAVTALARPAERARALAAGFSGYMSKPIEPQSFVSEIEAFLKPELRLGSPQTNSLPGTTDTVHRPHGEVILVVDNTKANLDFSASLLRYSGYSVITALSARDALRLAGEFLPDLILSDVCMPEGSGYEFMAEARKDSRLAATPFVFITSTLPTESERQRALALGAAQFLFRPIEPAHLLSEIRTCLQRESGARG